MQNLVQPYLEYCAPICSPHLDKNIDVLEKVQRKATGEFQQFGWKSWEIWPSMG